MSSAIETKDHSKIRLWAEKHKGTPSIIEGDHNENDGILRIKFDDENENLKEISWKEFFQKFDQHRLTFLYQDEKNSRFNKFVFEEEQVDHPQKRK